MNLRTAICDMQQLTFQTPGWAYLVWSLLDRHISSFQGTQWDKGQPTRVKKQKVYELNTTRNSCKSKPSKRIRTKKKTYSQYCGKFVSMSLDNDDHDENKNNNAATRTITKTTTPAKATTATLTNPLGSWGWRSVAYVEKKIEILSCFCNWCTAENNVQLIQRNKKWKYRKSKDEWLFRFFAKST